MITEMMNMVIETINSLFIFVADSPFMIWIWIAIICSAAIRIIHNFIGTDDTERNYEQPKQESQQEQQPEIKVVVKEVVKEVEKPQPKPIKDIKVKKIECSYCGASLEHNGTCKYCGTKHQIIKKY